MVTVATAIPPQRRGITLFSARAGSNRTLPNLAVPYRAQPLMLSHRNALSWKGHEATQLKAFFAIPCSAESLAT